MTDIGISIRKRRRALGLSQAELARLAGVSRATVVNVERGRSRNPYFSTIARLHDVLKERENEEEGFGAA